MMTVVSPDLRSRVRTLPAAGHANLAGFKVPDDRVVDGVDQTGLLLGKSKAGARDTYYYEEGNGVRQGKWKYLKAKHKTIAPQFFKDNNRKEVEELDDLESDLGETTNLAEKYPDKVAQFKVLMGTIAEGEK